MSDIAIRVEGLSKQYRIGGPQARYKTIRESLTETVQAPFRRISSVVRGQSSAVSNNTIWALKDVSFEVKRDEVVGIIGPMERGRPRCSRFSPASPSRRMATPRSTGEWAACWRWAPASTPS